VLPDVASVPLPLDDTPPYVIPVIVRLLFVLPTSAMTKLLAQFGAV
jgi:hypothetical protein